MSEERYNVWACFMNGKVECASQMCGDCVFRQEGVEMVLVSPDYLAASQALLAAKDEALRKVATLLADYGPSEELLNACHEAVKALSLTPAEALRRQEAAEIALEIVQRKCAECRHRDIICEGPNERIICEYMGVRHRLRALEEVEKG